MDNPVILQNKRTIDLNLKTFIILTLVISTIVIIDHPTSAHLNNSINTQHLNQLISNNLTIKSLIIPILLIPHLLILMLAVIFIWIPKDQLKFIAIFSYLSIIFGLSNLLNFLYQTPRPYSFYQYNHYDNLVCFIDFSKPAIEIVFTLTTMLIIIQEYFSNSNRYLSITIALLIQTILSVIELAIGLISLSSLVVSNLLALYFTTAYFSFFQHFIYRFIRQSNQNIHNSEDKDYQTLYNQRIKLIVIDLILIIMISSSCMAIYYFCGSQQHRIIDNIVQICGINAINVKQNGLDQVAFMGSVTLNLFPVLSIGIVLKNSYYGDFQIRNHDCISQLYESLLKRIVLLLMMVGIILGFQLARYLGRILVREQLNVYFQYLLDLLGLLVLGICYYTLFNWLLRSLTVVEIIDSDDLQGYSNDKEYYQTQKDI